MSLQDIYNRLGINTRNGLYLLKNKNWINIFPKRVTFLIKEKLEPKAFFVLNNKPLILFYDTPTKKQELFKAIWNFGESPVVIIKVWGRF